MNPELSLRRNLIYFVFSLMVGSALYGQTFPKAINYQAIARDGQGNPLGNTTVSIIMSIVTEEPTLVFQERHDVSTNALGMFDLKIGEGSPMKGSMDDIKWGEHQHFAQIEMSVDGSSFQAIGNSQLLAVPYAFYALEAGNAESSGSSESLWSSSGSNIYYEKGNVGIGVSNPNEKLSVKGIVNTIGPNGKENISLTRLSDNNNLGALTLHDDKGDKKAQIYVNQDKKGSLFLNNASGINSVYMTSLDSETGFVKTIGPNGKDNVRLTTLVNYPNNGYVGVYDKNGDNKAGIYVNAAGQGVVYADVKNFVMQHPALHNTEIVYASMEGPEAGAYVRGTSDLVNGEATIHLPEHFHYVASNQRITVQITPLSADSKGIAVIVKSNTSFSVKELLGGTGNYSFDWEVKAVRLGHENYEVIRPTSFRVSTSVTKKEE